MRDYITGYEVKLAGGKIIYGTYVKDGDIWYPRRKNLKPEALKAVKYFKRYGPKYFGGEWVRIEANGEIKVGKYPVRKWKENQIELWDELVVELDEDYTIHFKTSEGKITTTRVAIKGINTTFYLYGKEKTYDFVDFMLANYDVFKKDLRRGNIFRYTVKTKNKTAVQEIEVLPEPRILYGGYLEGVYRIPITYKTDNLKELLAQTNKPKIKGARKLFGPPAGVDFSNVVKLYSDPGVITYYFNDGEYVSFRSNRTVEINYNGSQQTYNQNEIIDLIYTIFDNGTTYMINLL